MKQEQATKLAKELQISSVRVVQEAYEMAILKGLAESKIGKFLVFKGGTALRLIYGSPRFSEDLDFSITQEFSEKDFKEVVREIASQEPNLELVEALKKRCTFAEGESKERSDATLFALFKIKEDFLAQPSSIKVEVSTREKIKEFETRVASSETTSFEVLLKTFSLEQLLREKKRVLEERGEPRDLFDLWYLGQKLKRPLDLPPLKIKKGQLKRELRKFLPRDYWPAVEELGKYAKD